MNISKFDYRVGGYLAPGFVSFLFVACNQVEPVKTPRFDNVVFIVSDDHAYTTLGAYGPGKARTPNLDLLAREGVVFRNAYCNSPICSASRQSLLTGKYPHSTGVSLLFTPFNDESNHTIAEHLKESGFATGLVGKTHFNGWVWGPVTDEWPRYGFDTLIEPNNYQAWRDKLPKQDYPADITYYDKHTPVTTLGDVWNAYTRPHRVHDEESSGVYLSQEAIRFIEQHKNQRFCLWLAYQEPHAPFYFPIEYQGKYQAGDIALPGGSPEDDRWVPAIFRNLTDNQRKGIIASYLTSVEYMDKNIGLVLDALEKNNLGENTLVVYISDNGYLLHDHKRFEKHSMWAPSVKIPWIMRGKGLPSGKELHEIVEGVDLMPTVCELLGIPPMPEAQGQSFVALFGEHSTPREKYAYSLFLEDNMVMIADQKWKYVFMTGKRDLGLEYATGFGAPGITHMLYDLVHDPGETKNLAASEEHAPRLEEMKNQLLDWFLRTHPDRRATPRYLSVDGQLAWFCEPRDVGAEHGGKPLRLNY